MRLSLSVLAAGAGCNTVAAGAGYNIAVNPYPAVRLRVPCVGNVVDKKLVVNKLDLGSFIFIALSRLPQQLSFLKRVVRVIVSDTYLCTFQFLALFEDSYFFIIIVQA